GNIHAVWRDRLNRRCYVVAVEAAGEDHAAFLRDPGGDLPIDFFCTTACRTFVEVNPREVLISRHLTLPNHRPADDFREDFQVVEIRGVSLYDVGTEDRFDFVPQLGRRVLHYRHPQHVARHPAADECSVARRDFPRRLREHEPERICAGSHGRLDATNVGQATYFDESFHAVSEFL